MSQKLVCLLIGLLLLLVSIPTIAQERDPIMHTLQVGDTLADLADHYNTCVETIIWANQLSVTSYASFAYLKLEGEQIVIPPQFTCDTLPTGDWVFTIHTPEETSIRVLCAKYRRGSWEDLMDHSCISDVIFNIGNYVTISEIQRFYEAGIELRVMTPAEVETQQNAPTHTFQIGDTFETLTEQYITCPEALIWWNAWRQMLRPARFFSMAIFVEEGWEITIPPVDECDNLRLASDYEHDLYGLWYEFQRQGQLTSTVGDIPLRVINHEAQSETTHIAQKGDSFARLLSLYDTCPEAIVVANDLRLNGPSGHSWDYQIQAGTELIIPPAVACDDLPNRIDPDLRMWHYYTHYQRPSWTVWGEGYLSLHHEIRVYDEDDVLFQAVTFQNPYMVASCFGITIEALREANTAYFLVYETIIIPDPQQDCLMRYDVSRYGDDIPEAPLHFYCYAQPLETLAKLGEPDKSRVFYVDESDGAFCYQIQDVYEILFPANEFVVVNWHDYYQSSASQRASLNWCLQYNVDNYYIKNVNHDYPEDILLSSNQFSVYRLPDGECPEDVFAGEISHTVQPGETLNQIAHDYHTLPQWLASHNRLPNPDYLLPGQKLIIPRPTLLEISYVGGVIGIILGMFALFSWGYRRRMRAYDKPKRKSHD